MHIAEAILHANSAGVVLFLLTSYIDAVRHEDVDKALPDNGIATSRDPEEIARCLDAVLRRAARRAHASPDSISAEIWRVFSAALNRLRQLERSGSGEGARRTGSAPA